MLESHTALFVAPTGVGKTHLALDLLEKEYKNHFDCIIIICSTLKHNETYRSRKWVWTDPEIILIEPGNSLYDWIEKIGKQLAGFKTLFLIDDILLMKLSISEDNLCLTWRYQEDIKSIHHGR